MKRNITAAATGGLFQYGAEKLVGGLSKIASSPKGSFGGKGSVSAGGYADDFSAGVSGLKSEKIVGNAIDSNKFAKMKAAFVKQGGIIDQSSEALRYLDYRGAEAVTFNESTIMLRENPTTSSVFKSRR